MPLRSSLVNVMTGAAQKAARHKVQVYLTGTSHDVRRVLFAQGIKPPLVHYSADIADAVSKAKRHIAAS